jgi:hypothetical protein
MSTLHQHISCPFNIYTVQDYTRQDFFLETEIELFVASHSHRPPARGSLVRLHFAGRASAVGPPMIF